MLISLSNTVKIKKTEEFNSFCSNKEAKMSEAEHEKDSDWKDDAKRFVLYLDIMGFKERVRRTNILELKKALVNFHDKFVKLKPLLEGPDGDGGKKTLMKMVQFSDSIVIVSKVDTEADLNHITRAAVILMQTALETGFALRGVISCGQMVFDEEKQLFFGNALVDAYLLEQEMCCYGVIFHATAEEKVNETLKNKEVVYFPIENVEIKLKNGFSNHYYVAWHKMKKNLSKGNMSKEALKWLKNLRETVSGNPRVYLDNTRNIIENNQGKKA